MVRFFIGILSVLLVVMFTTSGYSAEQKAAEKENTLAILDVEASSKAYKDAADFLTNIIRSEIENTKKFAVTNRSLMMKLFRERSFDENCVSRECAVEAGKLLGVKTVIIGSLNKIGRTYYLTLSRINVQTETNEFVVEEKCSDGEGKLQPVSEATLSKLLGDMTVTVSSPRASLPENKRFIMSDLTVFDDNTKLLWMKDTNKAGKTMTWDEANEYLLELNKQKYAGYHDWRLPEKNELITLIEYAKNSGVKRNLDELYTGLGFKNMKADYYWSATSAEETGLAWVIDLYSSTMSTANKGNNCYVWPMRSGR